MIIIIFPLDSHHKSQIAFWLTLFKTKTMNFLDKKTTWDNLELWVFKVCIFTAGICFGIIFFDYIKLFLPYFVALAAITTAWAVRIWYKKMKEFKNN
jgi:hypothetical protein